MERIGKTKDREWVKYLTGGIISATVCLVFLIIGVYIGTHYVYRSVVEIKTREIIIPEFYLETDGINIDTIFVYKFTQ